MYIHVHVAQMHMHISPTIPTDIVHVYSYNVHVHVHVGCAVLLCLNCCLFNLGCFFLPSFISQTCTCIASLESVLYHIHVHVHEYTCT